MSLRTSAPLLLLVATACCVPAACSSESAPQPPGATSRPPLGTPAPSSTQPAQQRGAWQVGAAELPWRLPSPVGREAAVWTSRGVVVAGGLVAGDASTATSYLLSLRTGHATPLPNLPVPVHDVGAALSSSGAIEVFGGGNATEQDVVQSEYGAGSWRVSGHLPTPRSDLTAVRVGRRVFVIGGYDGRTPALGEILVTAPVGFRVVGRLRVPVRYAAAAYAGRALWVFGGERNGHEVDAIQRVDLATGRTRVVGHLTRPLGHAGAVRVGGRVLLIGGRTSGTTLSAAMEWFDPRLPGSLRPAGRLPTPLADFATVVTGRTAYLVGGETPRLSDRVIRVTWRRPGT